MEQQVATTFEELKRGFIPAPERPGDWPAWRASLIETFARRREELAPPCYDPEAQAWASRCYAQGFLMLWDHELIDHDTDEWKVDPLLDRAERDFGGYDLVVLWNNYPLSGVDTRNQLQYYHDLPGGIEKLKAAVNRFHARGVRVLIDHKPWVLGTPEGFESMEEAFVDLVVRTELDGIYLDCSNGPKDDFRQMMAERAGPGKIFICEAPARQEPFGCAIGSWQQMTDDSITPGTYRNRWLDRNHIVCESRRYFYDPVAEIQRGWMNGAGQNIWENVFGYWAAYSERSKSWMRLMFPAMRRFADWFIHGDWQPHVGGGARPRVTLSRWTHRGVSLWTVCNRQGHDLEKGLFTLTARSGLRYVDVITGQEYEVLEYGSGQVKLGGFLPRDGIAGVLAVEEIDPDLRRFLDSQRACYEQADFSAPPWEGEHRNTELAHVLKRVEPTSAVDNVPEGMARVPERNGWMVTRYRMRECGYVAGALEEKHVYFGLNRICEYPRKVEVSGVALDMTPVTNAQFDAFLKDSGYKPKETWNFLKHWEGGHPPVNKENHPVVYVSGNDARAYARWAGKRLPTEEEWQAAAQGTECRLWPWGGEDDEPDPSKCNHASIGTTPVDAFPDGETPEGFRDMSGNVWEMTESERTDGHTRYRILKGGCWHEVKNSHWLFDTGAHPADWGAKQILLCDGWDRCSTIGFRCAADLKTLK
jgi:formylglycine-generating enzyme required for sulfatase activity